MPSLDDAIDSVTAPPAQPDTLDTAIDQSIAPDPRKQALRASLYGAIGVNPDQYAQAKSLSRTTGIPAPMVSRNLPDVQKRVGIMSLDDAVGSVLGDKMSDPEFAKVAHDDTGSLSLVETAANSFRRGVVDFTTKTAPINLVGDAKALASIDHVESLIGAGKPVLPNDDPLHVAGMTSDQRTAYRAEVAASMSSNISSIAKSEQTKAALPSRPVVEQMGQVHTLLDAAGVFLSDPWGYLASTIPQGAVGGAGAIAAGVAGSAVGGPVGAVIGTGAGMAASDFPDAVRAELQAVGVDISNPLAIERASRDTALMQRVTNAAIAHASVMGVAGAASAGVANRLPLPAGFAAKQVSNPIARDLAGAAAQVPLQGAIAAGGEAAGEKVTGRPVDPAAILAAGIGGGAMAPVDVLTVGGRATFERLRAARAANDGAQSVASVLTAAADSKLRARDPEAFKDFVKSAAPDASAFIDPRALETALQQAKIDPAEIGRTMPDVAAQLRESINTGADVEIPIADLATHVAGTPLAEAILPHLKVGDPEAMSLDESKAFLQTDEKARQAAQSESDTAEAQATAESAPAASTAVRDNVLAQLEGINRYTPPVNRAYADLLSAHYTATADRFGMTPETLLDQYPVRIAADKLDASPAFAASTEARGAYSPDERTIAIFKNADLSTFVHETGHLLLDNLSILAKRDDAPASVKADMRTMLDSFGVPDLDTWHGMSLDEQRTHHETFARSFERYLMEGEAPSLEMQGTFARFRAWLVHVYKSLTALHVELTPEVRGVMDRLLASDHQITTAQAARQHAPLFASAEAAGMSAEDFAAYQQLGAKATADAVATIDRRSLSDLRLLSNAKSRALRARQREVNSLRDTMREQVTREVEAEPVQRAAKFLKTGETIDPESGESIRALEGHRLDSDAVASLYPDSALGRPDMAKLRGMTGKGGLDPDVAAEAFGFSSGDHLIRSIADREDPAAKIEGLTDQRMLEAHGDITSRDSLERAAEAAIANDARGRMLQREVDQLSKAVGNRPLIARAAREYAAKTLAGKVVATIRPSLYEIAEARANREADASFRKGDTAAAAGYKRQALLDHELARGATKAIDEVSKAVMYLKKFLSPIVRSSIDKTYLDQVDGLLEKVDLRTSTSPKDIARRQSLTKWIESQRENGFEPLIPDALLDDAQRKSFKSMTLEEVRGLVDAVKNIEHLGRLKTRLLTAADQRDFAATVDSMASTIVKHGGAKRPEERASDRSVKVLGVEIGGRLGQRLVEARDLYRGFAADHRKFASVAREFDGWRDGGAVWDNLVRNMNEAGDREAVMREQATEKMLDLYRSIDTDRLHRKTYYAEAGKSFTGEERISIALNMGNEINRERVLTGEKLSPTAVNAIIADLSPEETKFVNDTWAHLDSYRPAIREKELRVSGVEPAWVEAQPFTLKLKSGESVEMSGGYYPIKYDGGRSERSAADSSAEIAVQMTRGLYARAQTARGHLKERSESTGRPLRYDLNVIPEHLSQTTHDLAWQEYLIDATRLLRSTAIEAAVRDHYGIEPLQRAKSLLTDIAVGDAGPATAFGGALNKLRYHTTTAALGLNVSNALINLTGYTQSVVRIGPKYAAIGLARAARDVVHFGKEADDLSPMMRLRNKTASRELSELRNVVSGETSRFTAIAMALTTITQRMVDVPTWYGAYEKAMAEPVMDQQRAVALADQAVLDSQGGGQTKDLAAIQRGDAFKKLFTTFYSFANTTHNLAVEVRGQAKLKDPTTWLPFFLKMQLLTTVPALANTIVKGALAGDLDDWDRFKKHAAADQIATKFGMMVGVRELAGAWQAAQGVGGSAGYSGPASLRGISDIYRLGSSVHHAWLNGKVDENLLRAINAVGGDLLGYPAGQADRTARGIEALRNGETHNPGVLITGPKPKN